MSTPEERGVKCRYLLPNGHCKDDKRRKCDFDPASFPYDGSLFTIDPGEVCQNSSIFGNRYVTITEEQIEELRAGKILSYVDEYGIFIKLEKEE